MGKGFLSKIGKKVGNIVKGIIPGSKINKGMKDIQAGVNSSGAMISNDFGVLTQTVANEVAMTAAEMRVFIRNLNAMLNFIAQATYKAIPEAAEVINKAKSLLKKGEQLLSSLDRNQSAISQEILVFFQKSLILLGNASKHCVAEATKFLNNIHEVSKNFLSEYRITLEATRENIADVKSVITTLGKNCNVVLLHADDYMRELKELLHDEITEIGDETKLTLVACRALTKKIDKSVGELNETLHGLLSVTTDEISEVGNETRQTLVAHRNLTNKIDNSVNEISNFSRKLPSYVSSYILCSSLLIILRYIVFTIYEYLSDENYNNNYSRFSLDLSQLTFLMSLAYVLVQFDFSKLNFLSKNENIKEVDLTVQLESVKSMAKKILEVTPNSSAQALIGYLKNKIDLPPKLKTLLDNKIISDSQQWKKLVTQYIEQRSILFKQNPKFIALIESDNQEIIQMAKDNIELHGYFQKNNFLVEHLFGKYQDCLLGLGALIRTYEKEIEQCWQADFLGADLYLGFILTKALSHLDYQFFENYLNQLNEYVGLLELVAKFYGNSNSVATESFMLTKQQFLKLSIKQFIYNEDRLNEKSLSLISSDLANGKVYYEAGNKNYNIEGNYEQAIVNYKNAKECYKEKNEPDFYSRYYLACSYYQLHQFKKLKELFERPLEGDKDDEFYYVGYAYSLIGDEVKAKELYQKIKIGTEYHFYSFYQLAVYYSNKKNFELAEKYLEQANNTKQFCVNPARAEYYINIAKAQLENQRGNYESAIKSYESAIQFAKQSALENYAFLAAIEKIVASKRNGYSDNRIKDDLKKCVAEYSKVLDDRSISYYQIAQKLYSIGWYELALDYALDYAASNSNSNFYRFHNCLLLTNIFIQNKEYDKALEQLQKAKLIMPYEAYYYNVEGDYYFARKAYGEALKAYQLSLLINPDPLLNNSYQEVVNKMRNTLLKVTVFQPTIEEISQHLLPKLTVINNEADSIKNKKEKVVVQSSAGFWMRPNQTDEIKRSQLVQNQKSFSGATEDLLLADPENMQQFKLN